jgi:thiamine transport system substrate-binding protein
LVVSVPSYRNRLMVFIFGGVAVIMAVLFGRAVLVNPHYSKDVATGHTLHILTYSSFVGATGPGPELISAFKKRCRCEVETATAGDAGLLVERVKLAHSSAPFDVVIGLDQQSLGTAMSELRWKRLPLEQFTFKDPAKLIRSEYFAPYDWAPMTFIYRKGEVQPPVSLDDLLDVRFKNLIAIEDPRSSTPGLQFYQWVRAVKGEKAEAYLEALKPNIHSVSPNWSYAYGLFQKKQAKLVFSYATSPIFHWSQEKDRSYQPAVFEQGHPYQMEYLGIPDTCHECMLATTFVNMMLSPSGQDVISTKNFMLPTVATFEVTGLFRELPDFKLIVTPLDKDLQHWMNVFGK